MGSEDSVVVRDEHETDERIEGNVGGSGEVRGDHDGVEIAFDVKHVDFFVQGCRLHRD